MSREKTLKKGYENIENEQFLYFVIILLFVLVDKLFKKCYMDGPLSVRFYVLDFNLVF